LDATQAISDRSLIAELVDRVRDAGRGRHVLVVAENEPQDATLLEHVDALWNDDFHHAARVVLTGSREGYLHDYDGSARELVAALARNFLYQGQLYPWQKQPRGRAPVARSSSRGSRRSRPPGPRPRWSIHARGRRSTRACSSPPIAAPSSSRSIATCSRCAGASGRSSTRR